jgi:hypothetical protein
MTEARTLIDAKHTGHSARDGAHRAANNGANRACGLATFAGAAIHAAYNALGHGGRRQTERNCNRGDSNKTTDHTIFLRSLNVPMKSR